MSDRFGRVQLDCLKIARALTRALVRVVTHIEEAEDLQADARSLAERIEVRFKAQAEFNRLRQRFVHHWGGE